MAYDKTALQFFIRIAVRAVVIVSQGIQTVILSHGGLGGSHCSRPAELLLRGTADPFIRNRVSGNLEHVTDFPEFLVCPGFGHCLQALVKIAHFQNFYMDARLGGQHGQIAVHVQHAGVIASQETESRGLQAASDLRGAAPVPYFFPGPDCLGKFCRDLVGHGAFGRIGKSQQAVHAAEGDICPLKGIGDFGDGTVYALGQPFAGIGMLIVNLRRGLQI